MKTGILIVALFCSQMATAQPKQKESWRGQMGELVEAFRQTIPYLYPDPSQDPKALRAKVEKLYQVTQSIDLQTNHAMKAPDEDPALPYLSGMLRQNVQHAYESLQAGREEYAKGVLRASISYCIACHTRTKSGTEFPLLSAFNEPMKRASWIERLEFQVASRQYDGAISEIIGRLKAADNIGASALDLERAARIGLSVAVRVKNDPDLANLLTAKIKESKVATFSLKESAKEWDKDIEVWRKARPLTDPDKIMALARELVAGAEPRLAGHSEVRHLRASMLMHDLLKKDPKGKHVAEALFIIGRSYDSIRDLGLWSLHEMYFLACVNRAPHTKIAQACYEEYKESVTLGYSGSSGVHLPSAVKKHLDSVRDKAKVK